jgi:histidinol dehydrogenase
MRLIRSREQINLLARRRRYQKVERVVEKIIKDVRRRKDAALLEYIERFDRARIKQIKVTEEEVEEAYRRVEERYVEAIKELEKKISSFHEKRVPSSQIIKEEEKITGTLFSPIQKVGIYIPAGEAPLVSTVIMTVTLAKVSGVEKIYVASPPSADANVHPYIIVASCICGASTIYKMGGAHAIAAMAYGTESVERVDKIFGPGNIYVTVAKKKVWGDVGVEMLAGPTEIAVIADESTEPESLVKDMLCQLEHGADTQALLFCTKKEILREVSKALKNYDNCFGIYVKSIDEAAELVNNYAPEHLKLSVKEPFLLLGKIRNAGCITLGTTPAAVPDYVAGPSHVLPTGGSARFTSALGVEDFMKRTSLVYYSRRSVRKEASLLGLIAELEGMSAHARSVQG